MLSLKLRCKHNTIHIEIWKRYHSDLEKGSSIFIIARVNELNSFWDNLILYNLARPKMPRTPQLRHGSSSWLPSAWWIWWPNIRVTSFELMNTRRRSPAVHQSFISKSKTVHEEHMLISRIGKAPAGFLTHSLQEIILYLSSPLYFAGIHSCFIVFH
jgi:hypothetical protein